MIPTFLLERAGGSGVILTLGIGVHAFDVLVGHPREVLVVGEIVATAQVEIERAGLDELLE